MIHVDRVHVVTDSPQGQAAAEAAGARLVHEVGEALAGRPDAPHVHVGELRFVLPGRMLGDPAALTRYARQVAQRILDRTPE